MMPFPPLPPAIHLAIRFLKKSAHFANHGSRILSRSMSPKIPNSFQGKKSKRWPWRQVRYFYYRFIRLKGHPDAIARGLAAGVFAGCFPIFGIQMLAGAMLAALVRGNIPLALGGTWISNPVTYIPLFIFNYHVGIWVLGTTEDALVADQSLEALVDLGADLALIPMLQEITTLGASFLIPLLAGCTVVGIVCAAISYCIAQWLLRSARQRHFTRKKTR